MESASQPPPSTSAPAAATPSPGEPRSAPRAPAAVPVPPPPPPPPNPLAGVPVGFRFSIESVYRAAVIKLRGGNGWLYMQGPFQIF